VKQQPTRRRGGTASLLAVLALAFVLWYVWARPTPAGTATPATPTATTTAESDTPAAMEASASSATPEATAPAGASTPQQATSPAALATVAPTATLAPRATSTPTPKPAEPAATPTRGPPDTYRGYPVISYDELSPEAIDTLSLIDSDGPFPFRKDGSTFQNRERLLPRKPNGYYREYTVITPGENDRGARRIIGGEDGERYYTDDHYASFYWVWIP